MKNEIRKVRKKELYEKVIAWFEEAMPVAETELHYESPFQLLVAVVLSAQCTDKRVNMVTPALFAAYPTAQAMADASEEEIFKYIRSVSYPHNKSRHLAGLSRMLIEEMGGEVPDDIEQLQRLPGVGRKTANVVAAVHFNLPAMPVDTHVFRVANRIGLTVNSKSPLQTERELVKNIPAELLTKAHHWLILHGRYVCQARKPKCGECGLREVCRYYIKGVQRSARECRECKGVQGSAGECRGVQRSAGSAGSAGSARECRECREVQGSAGSARECKGVQDK